MYYKIPKQTVEAIRSSVNIVDVAESLLGPLKKSGTADYFTHCPFHTDNNPSFCVNSQWQIFHCFSCGRSGNVFDLIKIMRNVDYYQAVRVIGKRKGFKIKTEASRRPHYHFSKQAKALYRIYDTVTKIYHHILVDTTTGEKALDYLHKRGLTDKTIDKYHLGYAPGRSMLTKILENQGVSIKQIKSSGLLNRIGKPRFRARVMFPIQNQFGWPVAFSGRIFLPDDARKAKYLNSPDSTIFKRRNTLFNLNNARNTFHRYHSALLHEGFMDVISSEQSNVRNAVASLGTSLTVSQVKLLSRYVRHVNICYDGDRPGQFAINRAIKLFRKYTNVTLSVITLPDGLDPDEYRQKYGEKHLSDYLNRHLTSQGVFQLNFLAKTEHLDTDAGLIKYNEQAARIISSEPLAIQARHIKKLVEKYHLSYDALATRVKQLNSQRPQVTTIPEKRPRPERKSANRLDLIRTYEMIVLGICINSRKALEVAVEHQITFPHEEYQELYFLLQGWTEKSFGKTFHQFIKEPELRRLLNHIQAVKIDTKATPEKFICQAAKPMKTMTALMQRAEDEKKVFEKSRQLDNQTKAAQAEIKLHRIYQKLY